MNKFRGWTGIIAVCVVALGVNVATVVIGGLSRPVESDAFYYLRIATSLAQGHGFQLHEGFWPDAPTMSRSPGWPFAVSLVLRSFPEAVPDVMMRLLNMGINCAVALLMYGLARRVAGRTVVAVWAGVLYAVHPVALYLAYEGASEPSFVLLVAAGLLLMMRQDRWSWVGIVLLGVACLVRANFVLWIVVFAGVMLLWRWRSLLAGRWVRPGVVALFLFLLPPGLWAVRNYQVCGDFPVFSTLRGQTLYGGNNPVVANELEYWGYWVFPDGIPGEVAMSRLAETRSEYQVDCYYYTRGVQYIRENWFSMPRLILGKLIRAYVPVPWKPNRGTYVICLFRWFLYGCACAGLWLLGAGRLRVYLVLLVSMMIVNLLTVAMFWGCTRFSFAVEAFLVPLAAIAVARLFSSSPAR